MTNDAMSREHLEWLERKGDELRALISSKMSELTKLKQEVSSLERDLKMRDGTVNTLRREMGLSDRKVSTTRFPSAVSLAEAAEEILRKRGSSMKVREIARLIEESGRKVSYPALSTALSRSSQVEKIARGTYRLTKK